MSRVLLTGATGFIGRNCTRALLDRGHEVHAVSRNPPNARDRVKWHQADLTEPGTASSLAGAVRPERLLHLAWYAEPGRYARSPENLRWVAISLELFRSFVLSGGARIVGAGSCFEYGGESSPCVETAEGALPPTLYGACKRATGEILGSFAKESGIGAAWGRIFHMYGPHEHPERLVPSVVRALLRGEKAQSTRGEQRRDWLHVEDVAEALVAILESDVTGPVNIGSGKPVAVRDVVARIAAQIGKPECIELGALTAARDEPKDLFADVSRLTVEVGWRPRYSLDEGLAETISWWKEESGV